MTLGLSTHDDEELENALRAKPDYIALGPIFPTTLKSMRFAPQGIPKITEWKRRIGNTLYTQSGACMRVSVILKKLSDAAMPQVHRMFFHYSEFPFSLRTLFTATLITLGFAYVFAMIQIYTTHAGLDGNPGINANDIAIAYSGNANSNRLQVALTGSMSANAPSRERRAIIDWAADGADQSQYEAEIKPIVDNRCMRCHDGKEPGAPLFTTFEAFAAFAKPDTGMSLATLVRVSHIHLFGMTFIFFIMGMIFSHAYVRPVWFKSLVIAVPFLTMITDIGSWYSDQAQSRLCVDHHHQRRLDGAEFCLSMVRVHVPNLVLQVFRGRSEPPPTGHGGLATVRTGADSVQVSFAP